MSSFCINQDMNRDSLNVNSFISSNGEDSLLYIDLSFSQLLSESKLLFADAIIADMNNDSLNTLYYFENLFIALAQLDALSNEVPEIVKLKYQNLFSKVIEYYDNNVVSIDHTQTGFSTAIFKDKLEQYIYSLGLDDLKDVSETVEVLEGHIPITYNDDVDKTIKFFQSSYAKPHIQEWLNREEKFKDIILPILAKENVPSDLFYVAMVESGLKTNAYSYAAAVGPWQFISSTAKVFDLKKTYYVDERRDIVKSTKAAVRYLKRLYRQFDDWYLAFAAYNCGETRVQRHLNCEECDYGEPPYEFWDLVYLPSETRAYVPKILAMIFVSKDPEKYGFKVESEEKFNWEIIDIDKTVTLEDISKCSNIDINTLRAYNPELITKNPTYVKASKDEIYKFQMPVNYSEKFDSLFALVEPKDAESVVFIKHKVKRGDSLWEIAMKYNSTITAICELNKINRNKHIRIGKVLTVPKDIRNKGKKYKTKPTKTYHYVKRGDTLSEIALKYRTSVRKIKNWNKLKNNNIKIGDKLIIYK